MSKLKWLVILSCLFIPLLSYAAGPITHVALGEMWLKHVAPHYTEEQKKLFQLGTVFPDIRYLGVIRRDQTHYKGVTLEKIKKTASPFQQGMLFHSYVDEFREKWLRKYGIEKELKDISSDHRGIFLKIIEDQILFSHYSWSDFRQYLLSIPEEEKKFKIDEKSLNEWHTGLTLYFTVSPGVILSQIAFLEKNILTIRAETIKQWGEMLPQYTASEKMQSHVTKMMQAFDSEIKKMG